MPITIKKGGATQRTAPVVPGALPAADQTTPQPKTHDQIKEGWKDVPPPNAKTKECAFCKQWYIKPCDQQKAAQCQNFLHLKGKAA